MEEKKVQAVQAKAGLIDPGTLLKDSWEVFKLKWKKLLLLSLLPYLSLIPFILVALLFIGGGIALWASHSYVGVILIAAIGIVLAVAYFSIAFSIGGVAMVYLILERGKQVSIKEALRKGWSLLWQYWIVGFLVGFIVVGGTFLFVIPGVIFSMWFIFAAYILVAEGTKGMDALMKSREYVRGYWWGVFGRYLLLVLLTYIAIAVGFGLTSLLKQAVLGQVLQYIISFTITPFTIIYFILMYENLKKIRPEVAASNPKGSWVYLTIGAFGFVLFVALLSLISYFAVQGFMNMQQNPKYRPGQRLQQKAPADYTMGHSGGSRS
jgi:hypothetical protein